MTEENEELTLREELEQQLNAPEEEKEEEVTEKATDEKEEESNAEEETEEEPGEEESEDDGKEKESEETEEGDSEEEEKSLEAPEHWSSEDRETFSTQSEEVKTYLLKRHNEMESGFTKKSQELAEQRKSVDSLTQFMDKWEPHTSSLGVPLVNGLEALLNHDRQLRTGTPEQKTQLLLQLAQQYGISMNTPQVEDEYTDPQLKTMQDQINMLNGNLTARDQQAQQVVEQQRLSAVNEAQAAVTTFKEVKDDSGNLKFPHFGTLEKDITALVQAGQAGTGDFNSQLEAAYDKALWMNPETREQLQQKQQSSQKAEDIKKQKEAAAQAKKSAKANKKGTSTKAEKPKELPSLRDDLAEQIRQAEASA